MKACAWGLKRIARELGCSHHTVEHYVAAGGVVPFKAPLPRGDAWLHEPKLDGYRQQVVKKGRQVRLYNERLLDTAITLDESPIVLLVSA